MDIHTNTSSRFTAIRLQRHKPALWLLLALTAGLALFGLALAVPRSMSADAAGPPSNLQSPSLLLAGVVNGGFESGDLINWSTGGSANRVEVLQVSDWTTSIGDVGRPVPTEGNYFVLLSTGPGVLGVAQGNIDLDGLATQDFDTSYLTTVLNPTASDVPATLSFDWSFLTAEEPTGQGIFDDFFRVRLNSVIILSGSRPYGGVSPFPDVGWMDNIQYTVTGGTPAETQGSYFGYGRSSFQTFRMIINDPGTYTLEFMIADQGDANDDSGLLIDNVQLIPEIDLEITKTATPDPAIAGDPLVYHINVTNYGSGRALDVVVTDTLPIPVDFITDTLPVYTDPDLPQGCTFSVGSGPGGEDQLFCDLGDMLGGESVSFDIEVDVDADVLVNGAEALVNKAEVDSLTADGDLRNNTIILETVLQDLADLRVVKVSKPDTSVRAGELFTYTIYVDNLGPSFARAITLTDDILAVGAFTVTQIILDPNRPADTCTPMAPPPVGGGPGPTLVECELGEPLEPYGHPGSGRWTIQIVLTSDITQDVNNRVRVVSADDPTGLPGTPDPDLSNNLAVDFISVTDVADLKITKIGVDAGTNRDGDPFTVVAGESVTWTITVENFGPSTSENVTVVDILPRGLAANSVIAIAQTPLPGGGQCTIGTPGDPNEPLKCNLGNLARTQTATVTIRADVVPSYVADQPHTPLANQLPNDAYLTSDTFDPDTRNNAVYDALVEVIAEANLSVTKSARGDNVTGYDSVLRQFTKTQLDNQVTAGELLQYTLVVTNAGPSDSQNVVVTDTLPPPAGPIATVNFLIADGAACRQDPVDRNKVTCDLGTVADTAVRTIHILVRVDPSAAGPTNTAVITNTATVTSSLTTDPYPSNNIAIRPATVNAVADIHITKVDVPAEARLDKTFEPDQAIAGKEHRYLITFGNYGPSVARNVNITDTLDFKQAGILGETFVRCEPLDPDDLVTCIGPTIGPSSTVTVTLLRVGNEAIIPMAGNGTLNPGDSFGFYLITKVDPGYVLDATNLIAENAAFISSSTTDVRTQNNQDTEQTEIIAEADLRVSKTDTPDPGQNLYYDPVTNKFVYTYTLTIANLGPSDAAKVVLTDTLPVDATFVRFETPADVQCYFRDDGVVFCLLAKDPNNQGTPQAGRLNVGSNKVMKISIEVDASAAVLLENCVEVKAIAEADFPFRPADTIKPADFQDGRTPTTDPSLANNRFCETTSLVQPAVKVDKKVYVRKSPARGIDRTTDGRTEAQRCAAYAADDILTLAGDELTYCYTITNEGDTWFHSVTLRDAPTTIVRTPTSNFAVAYPSQPPLRGTITVAGVGEAQTIRIVTTEPAKAVLAPKGLLDDYDHLLIVRSFTVDFPSGGDTFLGTNTARVDVIPSTKYSTPYPGIEPSGDCVSPNLVCDTDLLHDTLALPVLEETSKEWNIYEDRSGDGLPSPRDVIEYVVDIPNTGIIEATGVAYYDRLYNYIADDVEDLRVPGVLINGSVSAAIHVYGRDLNDTGRIIDADVAPPDLAFGQTLLQRTLAPAVGGGYLELTYPSAIVLDGEILKGNNPGDDEVHVATRLPIPPEGWLLRFGGVTYDPPIPVKFSLRIKYQVRLKETKYVRLGTIVLNHGWVSYHEIGLFDQRFPKFNPANPNQYLAANKVASNHAGTPARAWESPEFPGWPGIPVNVEPTDYAGLRFDDYALPGAPIRDDDDPTWFKLEREPLRIQVPVIDNADDWETLIQVQNGGDEETGAIVFFWGEYSRKCLYSDPGPVAYDCMRVAENGVWSIEAQDIPSEAKSAIVYSVDNDLYRDACRDAADAVGDSAAWQDWEDDYEGTGEPVAAIVQRTGPNDHDTVVSSAYPSLSENMEGGGPPYQYFAPYAMRQYHNLDTEIIIQNSGHECTEVWLDYQKQGDCVFSYSEKISRLTPGESIRKRMPDWLGMEWLGSIYIKANEPLGIVMDQTSFLPSDDIGTLLTYEARPYKLTTDTVFYADLVFRELSGWQASIQVQNLTQHSQPTFVTVEFFDASGDSILFVGDWVCRAGGTTFYLPAITDLGINYPAGYAGAAVIQSHAQVDYPGYVHDGQPIFAVVDIKKTKVYDESLPGWRHTMPGETQGGAYNALAEGEKTATSGIMLPSLAKAGGNQGVTSLIAVRNNANCNDIKLELEVRDGTGEVVTYLTNFWLSPGHIKLIDLANVGTVNPGFIGAGTVEVTDVRQLCDTDADGHMNPTPTMPSVVVVNKGVGPGDISSVYEGLPFEHRGSPCLVTVSGHVINELTLDPIRGADVNGHLTGSLGYYEFQVPSSMWGIAFTLDVTKDGYNPWSQNYTLYCDDLVVNPELHPE